MNEHEVAQAVAAGNLPSPQRLGESALFAVRVTGTGVAFRKKHDEHVYRPPENVATPQFLARCNGLAVTWGHPAADTLDSGEFADRVIGAVILPYLANGDGIRADAGQEVWGVARVFDEAAIKLMETEPSSTSPCVVFLPGDGNETFDRADGGTLLIEGTPSRLDHLAICKAGVWDRGGASGVRNDANSQTKEKGNRTIMATENDDKLDKMLVMVDSLVNRIDALEGAGDSKADVDPAKDIVGAAAAARREREDDLKEDAAKADAQARADAVASAHSEAAPPPLSGETLRAYRQRLVARFQRFSPEFKSIALGAVTDPALFDAVEGKIYADALTASAAPEVAPGHLRPMTRRDESGRNITTFHGSVNAWLGDFKSPKRYVSGITTQDR